MTHPSKAILLEVRASLANNNVRRAIASFSVNYGSTSEAQNQQDFLLTAGASKTITTPMAVSVFTLIRTSQPLNAVLTFRDASTLSKTITKLLVLDSDVASMVLTAASQNENDAKVTLLQG